jgi:hypothetical protein
MVASTAPVLKLPRSGSKSRSELPYGALATREVISGCGAEVISVAYAVLVSLALSLTNARHR